MQLKIEPTEPVIAGGNVFTDFMLPVKSPELKELLARAKYSGHEPINSVQVDESIVKLFQEAFEIDIKTCTEDEWTKKISRKGGALKQWQFSIKVREDNEIKNSRKDSLLFIALSALLLIGIGILPESTVPVGVQGQTATTVSSPAATTTISGVRVNLSATEP